MPSILSRLLPLALLFLTACAVTRYEYVPPGNEAGLACVSRCSAVRETCVADERQRADWVQEACERRNWWNYRFCTMGAFTRREAWACERHLRSCWVSDSSWRCDDDYRQCYSACGGRVIKITE